MKKALIVLLIAVCTFGIIGCGKKEQAAEASQSTESSAETSQSTESSSESSGTDTEEYPMVAYINDELYYGTGNECEAVPRKMPDGTIKTFVPMEIMPDAPDSANFGEEYGELQYMFLDDGGLIIQVGEQWMTFAK